MDTKTALHEAYTGEAKAALRLKVYAEKAEQEGYLQMAKLFRVTLFPKKCTAAALEAFARGKSTEENLAASFESEPVSLRWPTARSSSRRRQREPMRLFCTSARARMWKKFMPSCTREAMNHFMEERETTYYVCKVCGYVSDGLLPDECPVCNAKKEQFVHFD